MHAREMSGKFPRELDPRGIRPGDFEGGNGTMNRGHARTQMARADAMTLSEDSALLSRTQISWIADDQLRHQLIIVNPTKEGALA